MPTDPNDRRRRGPVFALAALMGMGTTVCHAQALSPQWEDLTSADFVAAIARANGVCLLPMGSIEKFGPSAPLGTNVYLVRLIPAEAAKQEYMVIFPDYFVANTTDAANLPGTIRYSMTMQLQFLDETTHEMARNGCKKIILANGHTGNRPLIDLYMGNFSASSHDYSVYTQYVSGFPVNDPQLRLLLHARRNPAPMAMAVRSGWRHCCPGIPSSSIWTAHMTKDLLRAMARRRAKLRCPPAP